MTVTVFSGKEVISVQHPNGW